MSSAFSWVLGNHTTLKSEDDRFFGLALENAHWASGSTHPNPSVGAVIVRDGQLISVGHTEKPGCMHAEKQAIHRAQGNVGGTTLYVTLEPCCHMGRTPPCTDAIIKAGISRVIYGVKDPNPMVAGKGIQQLRDAGILVEEINNLILREEANAAIQPFAKYILKKRPFVIVKIATSNDYAVAKLGLRTKITGPQSDKLVHQIRRAVDAVMVGANTVRIDNPQLLARLGQETHGKQPIRVILSHDLSFDPDSLIFDSTKALTWVYCSQAEKMKGKKLQEKGVEIIPLDSLSIERVLADLAYRGITSLLVEPGQRLLSSLIQENLIDEVWWFQGSSTIGKDALYVGEELKALDLFHRPEIIIGDDRLVIASISAHHL